MNDTDLIAEARRRADEIDNRLGPVPGPTADRLAVLLRALASSLAAAQPDDGPSRDEIDPWLMPVDGRSENGKQFPESGKSFPGERKQKIQAELTEIERQIGLFTPTRNMPEMYHELIARRAHLREALSRSEAPEGDRGS